MFDRFVRLAQARKALKNGHFEQAIQLAGDPLVSSQRRAEAVRARALAGLVQRARKRAEAGGISAALSDLSRVIAAQPEFDGARTLRDELQSKLRERGDRAKSARELLGEARAATERGELDRALAVCASASEIHSLPAEEETLHRLVEDRRQAALTLLRGSETAQRDGDLEEATERFARARAIDRNLPGAARYAAQLANAAADRLVPRLRELAAADVASAASLLRRERARLPELAGIPSVEACVTKLSGEQRQELIARLEDGALREAVACYRQLDIQTLQTEALTELGGLFDELDRALDCRDHGNFLVAARSFRQVARGLGVRSLKSLADQVQADGALADRELGRARELASRGDLVGARKILLGLLDRWPQHDGARCEMEILDQGARDREGRLATARELAKGGRLRDASAQVVALAVPGPLGDEARLLLRELQQRMHLVSSGLEQVLRAVHGRDSATRDGLVHCLRRIQELQKIQADHQGLNDLECAATAEIAGLDHLGEALAGLGRGDASVVTEALAAFSELTGSFLQPDRLAARHLDLGDRLLETAESDLHAGRLRRARSWLDAIASRTPRELSERTVDLRERIDHRMQQAVERATEGCSALAARDVERAEECLAAARVAWVDAPEARRLEQGLLQLRSQERRIADVEAMAVRKDYTGAQRGLGHMGPTPEMLRTRIFDLKRSIAKAQGLDHAFILRVDEGGEFLVVRGDSVTIGNLRDGRSDLPLLANLAGCHARIRRSMSFHGGMQDTIVAERGDMFVGDASVDQVRLKSGTRVRLGSTVEIEYSLPSQRSLTALLALRGGFQVAGCDRILLMKDRGRDGRILIGGSKDAHVRVPGCEHEIEVFAGKDGQVRIRCLGQGSIDGRPFSGEHPVMAGAVIVSGGLSLVLQPWTAA